MMNLDIPEMLIVLLLGGALAWAIYNRTHPDAHAPK